MLYIHGMGVALAKNEIDNDFLHKEVGLTRGPAWVDSRLGIYKRRSVLSREYILKTKNKDPEQAIVFARSNGETPVSLAVEAARQALKNAGVKAEQIGWVISNNDTPFETVPNTASLIAKDLGVGSGPHCDVNAACSSFARHMKLLGDARQESIPEFILCVQGAAYTTRTHYTPDSVDPYIWGDGACAQVCSVKREGRLAVEPMIFGSDVAPAREIMIDTVGYINQNGGLVREFSIRKTCEMFEEIAQKKGLYAEEIYTVAHQANYVMQKSILGHLNLPLERHLTNVQQQGNIGAAGCPSAIAQNWDRFHKGDQIVYAVLGAGLEWGGGYMEVK